MSAHAITPHERAQVTIAIASGASYTDEIARVTGLGPYRVRQVGRQLAREGKVRLWSRAGVSCRVLRWFPLESEAEA